MLKNTTIKIITIFMLLIGSGLLLINIYGLFQDIRPPHIENSELRFPNDQPISYDLALNLITLQPQESKADFAKRATQVVAKGLAHIHWEKYEAEKFNQLIPIWENYFLYLMGKFSGIPEYKKYHFADYKRSLKRGIGLCGDASMTLSQILDLHNITNKILTYPGHVVVATNIDGYNLILDPDFGVTIPLSTQEAKEQYQHAASIYVDAGYTEDDRIFFERLYKSNFKQWDGVSHFITKKYYFEKVSYWLKWFFPLFCLALAIYLHTKNPSR